ncbi:HAMP domain-containing histidine kinase [Streptomyces sp. LP05-1]|uniref:histidine kinase n=1 Tax=Streptomyces pyxinae TaxID=2970734 RepID=A0ABT2C9Y1_9ACTN|nr:HAMP domain-containing sensor histidine kinase [Streptomyces sp. LP05-1]MCS0634195.1 HAMP domain-containing histidine kinase [Streptomyces sp. LP05-1]
MRRPLGSVRARTALGATLVVALALAAAGIALLAVLRGNLVDQAGFQANVTARSVAEQVAGGVPFGRLDLPDDTEEHPVQVLDGKDRVVAVGKHIDAIEGTAARATRPVPTAGNAEPDGDDDTDTDADTEGGGQVGDDVTYASGAVTVAGERAAYRFAAVEAKAPDGTEATVWAGAPLAAEAATVSDVQDAMLAALPALLVVVAGVTWLVTGRALKPVEAIRRRMATITASEDLARRVPEPGTHDEVARLARTTNETLAALEASVERQRRFVADASHELRSPIASLRTQLEVGAAHPELLDVPGAVADTVRLQQLAADLLLLARLDAGERPGQARVELAALVREELAQRAGDRVPVAVEAAEPAPVAGSRGQLGRLLGNLLDNAQRHAEAAVTVSVRTAGRQAVLGVADDGAGVPEGERERIFERFVRLDDARSRDEGGAGLGLAIARDVAARHGGTLAVRRSPGGGALFELRLPVAEES